MASWAEDGDTGENGMECGMMRDTITSGTESGVCFECEKCDWSNKIAKKPIGIEGFEESRKCENKNSESDLLTNKRQTTKVRTTNTFTKSKSEPSIKFERNETNKKPNKRTKSVLFADTEGMELTETFYFKPVSIFASNEDEIEVFTNFGTNNEVNKQIQYTTNVRSDPKLFTSLRSKMVALETISVDSNALRGRIHVLNIEYHKQVFVRWTQDDWLNSNQSEASFETSLKSVFVDVFVFDIPVKICKTEFAIVYRTGEREYWDNNNNNNYVVDCYL